MTSFYLSRTSLYCMLSRIGFTSVYECYIPPEPSKPIDRITLLAIKGRRQEVISSPLMDKYPIDNSPEDFTLHKIERLFGKLYRISRVVPEPMRILMGRKGF